MFLERMPVGVLLATFAVSDCGDHFTSVDMSQDLSTTQSQSDVDSCDKFVMDVRDIRRNVLGTIECDEDGKPGYRNLVSPHLVVNDFEMDSLERSECALALYSNRSYAVYFASNVRCGENGEPRVEMSYVISTR